MIYDWKELHEDAENNIFKPLHLLNVHYPVYEINDMDPVDFNHMQKLINSNIIIPIDFEEENEEPSTWSKIDPDTV